MILRYIVEPKKGCDRHGRIPSPFSRCHHKATTRGRHFSDRNSKNQRKLYDHNLAIAYDANLENNTCLSCPAVNQGGRVAAGFHGARRSRNDGTTAISEAT